MKTQQPAQSRKFQDKGFYIILILCLAAIAVSAYVLFWMPDSSVMEENTTPDTQVMQSEDQPKDETPTQSDTETQPENQTKSQTSSVVQTQAKSDSDDSAQTFGKSSDTGYVLPVKNASVLKVFSNDTLQYDVTMGDWRVHEGTDYAGKLGDRVYAVGAGTVTDVTNDPMYGYTIALDLGNNLTCRYTGLNSKVKVKKGDTVKAGSLIGAIGDTNTMESKMDSHLHFEMYRNGQAIDPEEILPQEDE